MPDAIPHRYYRTAANGRARPLRWGQSAATGRPHPVAVRRHVEKPFEPGRGCGRRPVCGRMPVPRGLNGSQTLRQPCGENTDRVGFEDGAMKTVETEGLLSPRQLAAYLNVPVATVYDWRHRRFAPPGFRLGKHFRYRRSDVDKWIDDQAQASTSGRR